MTNASLSETKFTVAMHPTLVDELDEGFSPMDGLVAIDQMFGELPIRGFRWSMGAASATPRSNRLT